MITVWLSALSVRASSPSSRRVNTHSAGVQKKPDAPLQNKQIHPHNTTAKPTNKYLKKYKPYYIQSQLEHRCTVKEDIQS